MASTPQPATPRPATSGPATPGRIIVVGNEKGGAGKSTIAMHLACSLLQAGARVTTLDLDLRQQSLGRFFSNRRAWAAAHGAALPMPTEDWLGEDAKGVARIKLDELAPRVAESLARAREAADFVIVDTPGADTPTSRAAHGKADQIVTPLNDSFVDFDMLGHVDPVTLDLTKPSLYAEAVWEARKLRMVHDRASVDWLVLRNRLATTEARNRKRLDERIEALSKRVGFRIGPGLRDRVIYRELFPFGLTVADLSATVRPVAVSLSHVAARQEMRAILTALGLEAYAAGRSAIAAVTAEEADAALEAEAA